MPKRPPLLLSGEYLDYCLPGGELATWALFKVAKYATRAARSSALGMPENAIRLPGTIFCGELMYAFKLFVSQLMPAFFIARL